MLTHSLTGCDAYEEMYVRSRRGRHTLIVLVPYAYYLKSGPDPRVPLYNVTSATPLNSPQPTAHSPQSPQTTANSQQKRKPCEISSATLLTPYLVYIKRQCNVRCKSFLS